MSPQVLIELRGDASSLALDWVHKNLFWALPNSIVKSNLDGSNREEIVRTDHPALDLTVDPYDRYCRVARTSITQQINESTRRERRDVG